MTPSEAYAALHEKWPELRPKFEYEVREMDWDGETEFWETKQLVWWFRDSAWVAIYPPEPKLQGWTEENCDETTALSACFVACVEACARRCVELCLCNRLDLSVFPAGVYIDVPINNIHSIAIVMDRVMQLPEVPRA